MPANKGVAGARIKLAGKDVDPQAMALLIVKRHINMPDMLVATLNNTNDNKYTTTVKQGDEVEVKIGPTVGDPISVFKGEIIGLNATYDVRAPSSVKLTAVNKLHRLTREKRSKTWQNMTDHAIVEDLIKGKSYGLRADCKGQVTISHPHIYQQHQTDLEFLLERCRRINYEVLCLDNQKLTFRERRFDDTDNDKYTLVFGREGPGANEIAVEGFTPRVNSTSQVKKVKVHSKDASKSTQLIGEAGTLIKILGKTEGPKAAAALGKAEASYELPVLSKEEAKAAATAIFEETSLNYINAEVVCKGDPRLRPGIVVELTADPDNDEDRFNGKYYIIGVEHRYTHKSGGDTGGFATTCEVSRNAEGKA